MSMKVLVAEDNPVNQEVVLGILEALGCEATIVENGLQAVEAYTAAAAGCFDVILMDCQMPVMDGMETSRRIRALEDGQRHIPILALTANAIEGSKKACLDAGMDDMLSKPFRPDALQALLEKWRPRATGDDLGAEQPAATPSPSCQLDEEPLDVLRDLDPDGSKQLLHRTIIKFFDYGDGLMADMARRLADDDREEIARLAHSLKSSSANLGAVDLSRQCQDIEALAKGEGRQQALMQRIDMLEASYQQAKRQLQAFAGHEVV